MFTKPKLIYAACIVAMSVMLSGTASTIAAETPRERLVVFYGDDAPAASFPPYSVAVLDSDQHPTLAPLKAAGVKLFGYLSLGEIEAKRPLFSEARRAGILLGENPDWAGARYVDVRRPEWRALVLDRLVPAITAQGFDGLFLDTLDDAATLEPANHGMVAAAADLVRAIHERFPAVPLMLNRAYDVGKQVAPTLTAVLAESLASTYNFRSHRYTLRTAADLAWGMNQVVELRRLNPAITVYTLDYWNPSDRAGMARLYAEERRSGFIPYVATIDLQHIIPEPTGASK